MAKTGVKSKVSQKQQPKQPPPEAEIAENGSVEKIRDILFGNQMREFQKRFFQLEERLAKANQDLRDETQKRLEALETFFKNEQASIKSRVKSEAQQRESEDIQLREDLKTATASLQKHLNDTEEKYLELTSELRQQILNQSKSLSADIQLKNEQTNEMLQNTANGLEDAKIDRSVLAEYLIEMAMRISDHEGIAADKN